MAHVAARGERHVTSYPYVVFYNGRAFLDKALLAHGGVDVINDMISSEDKTVGAHHDVIAYLDVARYVTVDTKTAIIAQFYALARTETCSMFNVDVFSAVFENMLTESNSEKLAWSS